MTDDLPLVTVIVPARDERADIIGCIEAIAAQEYPADRLEVLVVDGCSEDETASVAAQVLERCGFVSTAVISNPGATTSSNLNVGLARAAGEIICRVDARTRIVPHYVRTCVQVLLARPEVSVVGGAQVAVPANPRAISLGIARALNNRWSMGGSRYRRATSSGPSDTVYLGAFRHADLVEAGGWDEDLVSNQDFDLNRRMARRGLVWYDSSLRSGYVPRRSFGSLWRQYTRFGRSKVHYWRTTGRRPEFRQWVLLLAPLVAMLAVGVLAMTAGPSLRLALGAAGFVAAAAVLIEVVGAPEPRAGVWGHLCALGAIAVVATGWWWGALSAAAGFTSRGGQ